uniref:Uncharacterized protein n=1 Tax=Geospiza parvula TaxID=87175 RepID=A0A8U8B3I9_GEOPR
MGCYPATYHLHFTEMLKTFFFHCHLHSREQLSYLLKNYNSYYSDQENLQLTYNQQEGSTPFIEGILSIFWGVRHPIRLKIQDEKQIPSFVTLKSTENVGFFPVKGNGWTSLGRLALQDSSCCAFSEPPSSRGAGSCTGRVVLFCPGYPRYESHTLRSRREQELDCATLPRSSSDAAAVRRRTKLPTITRTEVETHRFSINGHFYNHETSVFTPAFGSETKIRINSQMRSRQVIEQLLRKFKIENSPHEFALYIIHASGGKPATMFPLLHRLLQGPSEKVAKFFLMDGAVEEISSDVC